MHQKNKSTDFTKRSIAIVLGLLLALALVPTLAFAANYGEPEQTQVEGQIGNLAMDILAGNVPLGSLAAVDAWSLTNLIMILAASVCAIAAVVSALIMRLRDGEQEFQDLDHFRFLALKGVALVMGLVTTIVFLALENLSQPYCWINQWTLLIGIMFALTIVAVIVQAVVCKPAQ